ncbi:hypothetical protein KQH60_05810 [Mycetohabitans sp. B8]|uniref:hypothetical protein n=1 Tax=Mycetohabitans sp. B8 TaxID=2841845 RepID=UPI001F480B23|nr:hypothetical protein [Mycetohabitans sp. B8]MCG1042096.1 hypothetical protein [Mycetohabitans sp. B8]
MHGDELGAVRVRITHFEDLGQLTGWLAFADPMALHPITHAQRPRQSIQFGIRHRNGVVQRELKAEAVNGFCEELALAGGFCHSSVLYMR